MFLAIGFWSPVTCSLLLFAGLASSKPATSSVESKPVARSLTPKNQMNKHRDLVRLI